MQGDYTSNEQGESSEALYDWVANPKLYLVKSLPCLKYESNIGKIRIKENRMSYSLESPCGNCLKRNVCADGVIIAGARNTIHYCPVGLSDKSWHQGSGTIRHECNRFEPDQK